VVLWSITEHPKATEAMIDTITISEVLDDKGNQLWSVAPDTLVYDAIQMMADKNIGALPVIEGERILGIISERDYTRKVVLQGKSSKSTSVREIITGQIVAVTPDQTVQDGLRLMTKHRIRHLPVMKGSKLLGIVSIGDLVNAVINAQQATIDQLQTYINGVPS
jgi:signal-transduction protein with cAMP-binding, CBS, and nucleotidyltransferase domain